MVPPENPGRLAQAIAAALDDPAKARAGAEKLRERIGKLFSQDAMVEGVLGRLWRSHSSQIHAAAITTRQPSFRGLARGHRALASNLKA